MPIRRFFTGLGSHYINFLGAGDLQDPYFLSAVTMPDSEGQNFFRSLDTADELSVADVNAKSPGTGILITAVFKFSISWGGRKRCHLAFILFGNSIHFFNEIHMAICFLAMQ